MQLDLPTPPVAGRTSGEGVFKARVCMYAICEDKIFIVGAQHQAKPSTCTYSFPCAVTRNQHMVLLSCRSRQADYIHAFELACNCSS